MTANTRVHRKVVPRRPLLNNGSPTASERSGDPMHGIQNSREKRYTKTNTKFTQNGADIGGDIPRSGQRG